MKRKIFVSSIFSVVIIILMSFTNVIGYTSNNSDSVEISPLFITRTNKAIEQDNNLFSSNYIGKGKEIKIQFPEKNNEKEMICKYIDAICHMDDNSFKRLISKTIFQVNKDDKLKDIGANKVLLLLNSMRVYPDELKSFLLNEKDVEKKFTTSNYTIGLKWKPGCFLQLLISSIIGVVIIIIFATLLILDDYISAVAPTECFKTCIHTCQTPGDTFCQKGDCIKS